MAVLDRKNLPGGTGWSRTGSWTGPRPVQYCFVRNVNVHDVTLFHATPQAPSSFQSPAPAQFQPPAPQGGNHSAFTQPEEPEPEVVRQWREHQAEKIAQRDEESKKKREETIARAERKIDKFYEEYNAKKERTIRENKENEADYLSALTDSLSSGTTWSCICDIVLARWHRFHALLRGAVEAEEARGQGARCSWVLTMGIYG